MPPLIGTPVCSNLVRVSIIESIGVIKLSLNYLNLILNDTYLIRKPAALIATLLSYFLNIINLNPYDYSCTINMILKPGLL